MYQQFKGIFSTPVSFFTFRFLYHVHIFIGNSSHKNLVYIANFDFCQAASSITVGLNSSLNSSANFNFLLLLNISVLHNASQISDNWLRISRNPRITYTAPNISGKHFTSNTQADNHKVLSFNKIPFLKIHFCLILILH